MKNRKEDINKPLQNEAIIKTVGSDGNLSYPANEDIYKQGIKLDSFNPGDLSKLKEPNEMDSASANEKDFDQDKSGDDLDVPGAELDDDQEAIGSEDEENNYYSLGGDNHNNLEEDRG
jgi:hypothetical protein